MSSVDASSETAAGSPPVKAGEIRLEVVVLPRAASMSYTESCRPGSFAAFSDPDGNGWLFQEIKARLPGR
jgi:hypothetical protein